MIPVIEADDAKQAPSGVPQATSGTYSVAGGSVLSRRALPNACFIEMNLTIALQGTFEGPLTAHVTMFSRGACPEAGTADELHGQGTFVGTVATRNGLCAVVADQQTVDG